MNDQPPEKKSCPVTELCNELPLKTPLVVFGAILTLGLVISAMILSNGIMNRFEDQIIDVTGASSRVVTSDRATLTLRFGRQSSDMKVAIDSLKADTKAVKAFLKQQGIKAEQITVKPVESTTLYTQTAQGYSTNDIEGYRFNQAIDIESTDPKSITALTSEVSVLLDQGIVVTTEEPQFFYTKLDSLKVELLREATKNALERAKAVVEPTGRHAGAIRAASTGVFQITPKDSAEVSDYGLLDTTSVEKKVTAVVNASFSIN